MDADTGAEAQNSDFVTMQGVSFSITKKRWVLLVGGTRPACRASAGGGSACLL